MRGRRLRWLLALAGLVGLAGAFVLWPRQEPASRITQETFDCIRVGMSRAEVEALLGRPGDYSSGPMLADPRHPEDVPPFWSWSDDFPPIVSQHWCCDAGQISIRFGPGGVARKNFMHGFRMEQGALENLEYRAKRQWHRWFPPK
jgi:hypothetical protein